MTLKYGSSPTPPPRRSISADHQRKAGSSRRRGAELEEALLHAAWAVLVDSGYSGFTYDAIAVRAQTSRAVLYRRWPQRRQLLERVLQHFWTPIEIPDTGSLREDGIALLRAVNNGRAELMTVLTQQLADYFRETGTTPARLRHTLGIADRENPFEAIIARSVERGELESAPTTPRILGLPLDLLRQDMMMHVGADSEDAITEIIDRIWLPLLHHESSERA